MRNRVLPGVQNWSLKLLTSRRKPARTSPDQETHAVIYSSCIDIMRETIDKSIYRFSNCRNM
jgi:hypothetical protein